MNEDTLNMSVRKFLKLVGVTSQREIEQAIKAAIEEGRLKGDESLPVSVTLRLESAGPEGTALERRIESRIELE